LHDIYTTLGGANWKNKKGWSATGTDPCTGSWYGVKCSSDGTVTGLALDKNNLKGKIPDSIGLLTSLTNLEMRGNSITGTVPASIGRIIKLKTLVLAENTLSGTVPAALGSLSQVTNFDFRINKFSGTIPPELGGLVSLTHISFAKNSMSGIIPETFSNLKKLEQLIVHHNNFSGPIHPFYANMKLWDFHMSMNAFTGTIPDAVASIPTMKYWTLDNNRLNGTIPSVVTKMTKLELVDVSSNADLTGTVPAFLCGFDCDARETKLKCPKCKCCQMSGCPCSETD